MDIKQDFKKFSADTKVRKSVVNDYINYQNSMTPNILEQRQLNVTQMDVFSRLMQDRIIFLGDKITSDVANVIQAQLLFLSSNDPSTDITIYIASPGGEVYYGLGIYDTIKFIEPDVKTCCVSLAASMGSILLGSGAANKRSALPNSRIMIHQPLGGVSGQASDIEIEADEIKFIKERIYTLMSNDTGQSFEKLYNDADRNNWMTPQEAKNYGLIDKVIS